MTAKTKKYLKIVIGLLLLLVKLLNPPLFWSWDTAEGVGHNVATIAILILALWLLYSGGRQRTDK